jgi:hypothetical protein
MNRQLFWGQQGGESRQEARPQSAGAPRGCGSFSWTGSAIAHVHAALGLLTEPPMTLGGGLHHPLPLQGMKRSRSTTPAAPTGMTPPASATDMLCLADVPAEPRANDDIIFFELPKCREALSRPVFVVHVTPVRVLWLFRTPFVPCINCRFCSPARMRVFTLVLFSRCPRAERLF